MAKFLKNHLVIVVVLLVSVVIAASLPFIKGQQVTIPFLTAPTPTATVTPIPVATTFFYEGEEGKDALAILKEKTEIEVAPSGLVVSINGRKADDTKHEFWAFYVNGEMAQVGPAQYQTKDSDKIEWKIEKY